MIGFVALFLLFGVPVIAIPTILLYELEQFLRAYAEVTEDSYGF